MFSPVGYLSSLRPYASSRSLQSSLYQWRNFKFRAPLQNFVIGPPPHFFHLHSLAIRKTLLLLLIPSRAAVSGVGVLVNIACIPTTTCCRTADGAKRRRSFEDVREVVAPSSEGRSGCHPKKILYSKMCILLHF